MNYILIALIFGLSAALMATPYFFLALFPPLALLGWLVFYRWPQLGYYLIIFLIPFGEFRKVGGVNIPWVVAALLLLVLLARILLKDDPPKRLNANIWPWFLGLFAVSAVSAVFSEYPDTGYHNLFLLAVSSLFILFGLAFVNFNSLTVTMPKVLIVSISFGSILAILGFFFGISWFSSEQVSGAFVRGRGGAGDPNNMSMMILFVLPLIVHAWIYSKNMVHKLAMLVLIVINMIGLLTTYSRSGMVILAWTVLLLAIENRHRFKPRQLGFLLLGVALLPAIILPLMPDSFWDRHASLGQWEDRSLGRRTAYLIVGGRAFLDSPMFGSGPGTFPEVFARSPEAQKFAKEGKTLHRFAHNTYLEFIVGTGVFGIVFFLLLVTQGVRNFSQCKRMFQEKGGGQWASLAGHYRVSLLSLLTFLVIFSEPYHKYLLLALPLSQVAVWLAADWTAEQSGEVVDV
ncbi:MAG: O-antigen ligase family protein [Magnetococcales bacterium]|nr:O-antigen ligase family protein [Magnetococcales bacterium]